jgi:predicted Zn-ribbon and HTH transcriptional regulator
MSKDIADLIAKTSFFYEIDSMKTQIEKLTNDVKFMRRRLNYDVMMCEHCKCIAHHNNVAYASHHPKCKTHFKNFNGFSGACTKFICLFKRREDGVNSLYCDLCLENPDRRKHDVSNQLSSVHSLFDLTE